MTAKDRILALLNAIGIVLGLLAVVLGVYLRTTTTEAAQGWSTPLMILGAVILIAEFLYVAGWKRT